MVNSLLGGTFKELELTANSVAANVADAIRVEGAASARTARAARATAVSASFIAVGNAVVATRRIFFHPLVADTNHVFNFVWELTASAEFTAHTAVAVTAESAIAASCAAIAEVATTAVHVRLAVVEFSVLAVGD